jgi:hypothetical protein
MVANSTGENSPLPHQQKLASLFLCAGAGLFRAFKEHIE